MISLFSYAQPDNTLCLIDVASLFPAGCNSARIREYGISVAEQYPDVCRRIAAAANDLYHECVDPDAELYGMDDCIERIGIKLGQEIHRHLMHDEESADIWRDVADRIAYRASGGQQTHIYIIERGD